MWVRSDIFSEWFLNAWTSLLFSDSQYSSNSTKIQILRRQCCHECSLSAFWVLSRVLSRRLSWVLFHVTLWCHSLVSLWWIGWIEGIRLIGWILLIGLLDELGELYQLDLLDELGELYQLDLFNESGQLDTVLIGWIEWILWIG